MKKFLSFILIVLLVLSYFEGAFALSNYVVGSENIPGKMDIKNVNGIGKNIGTDFFGGAMTFTYPFSFPNGSRGLTPSLSLTYSSNNSDAFSPYGYGFSLSLARIQRSAKKWVSELYVGDEYAAFWSDLIRESTGSIARYRSKNGNDLNLYIQSGSSWIVQTPTGRVIIFWSVPTSRIANPENPWEIYAWLVDEERDIFGHSIRYSYFIDGGQPYVSDIFYGYERGDKNPLYTIHFDYIAKSASLTSHRTQFEVSTKKLLSRVSLRVNWTVKHTYSFIYDNPDNTISHLVSIEEEAWGVVLPSTQFDYGEGQFQHMIASVDNSRWGKARFEYAPSTGYRDNSWSLMNTNLPFTVMTLSRQTFEDSVTGIQSEESYSYSSGHYYYDSSDLWGREYVGFGEVTISDDKTKKVLYFHQSQTSWVSLFKYQDHISKKWLIYKTDIIDKNTNKLLKQELIKYNSRVLFSERRLVYPIEKINSEFDDNWVHRDTAITYEYDNDGNRTREMNLGFVNTNLTDGTYIDIAWDSTSIDRTYISNPNKNLYNFLTSEKVYGFSGELLTSSLDEYDNTSSWLILWLLTTKKRQNVENKSIVTIEKTVYSPTWLPAEQYDAENNRTIFMYDTRDIALISIKNPLGWGNRFVYDYVIWKPIATTNQNNVISTIFYDGFGRVFEQRQNTGSWDIILSRTIYDDTNAPNSITTTQFYDTAWSDSKITKSYTDGWGRTITTISTTEKLGQYSASQVRYDDDGNPIYGGYPVFVSTDSFDASLMSQWVMDWEYYRNKSPGMSFTYDALDRIISQRDTRWVIEKSYSPGKETIKNALGNITEARYDALGNLTSFVEKLGNRDIVTKYVYDALGRPVSLIDAYNNSRSWNYDGLGRLKLATDLHASWDTTYGIRQYEYDILGRVKKYTNAKNEQVSYTYDALSRITRESYPSSHTTSSSGIFIRDYAYDSWTRSLWTLSSIVDSNSMVNYGYDSLGRKTSETRSIENKRYTLNYGYNSASILTDISYPDGGKTKYTYKRGFIEWVGYTDPQASFTQIISDISYAPNSTMKSIRYGNGVIKNTERDANNNYRLARAIANASDGTKLLDTSYSYDVISNIVGITENGIDPLRKTISYTYDSLARLSSANYSYNVAGYGRDQTKNLTYTYDDIGNISTSSEVGAYNYAGTNFANPHAVTTAGDTNYLYDEAGNTILGTSWDTTLNFTYSPYGEMLSSVKNWDMTSYTYDSARRRISKTTLWLTEHHVIDGYEVEYESGALVPVSVVSFLAPIDSGTTIWATSGSGIWSWWTIENGSGITSWGGVNAGSGNISNTWWILIDSGVIKTVSLSWSTQSGTVISSWVTSIGMVILTGSTTDTWSTVDVWSGRTSSWLIMSATGEMQAEIIQSWAIVLTATWETSSWSISSWDTVIISSSWSTESGTYIVIAGYTATEMASAISIWLVTSLTHIYLWDERIATFQSQTDDAPKTYDDDTFIFHISDHLNSSSLDLSSTWVILQATDYQPFWKTVTYQVTSERTKWKKWWYKNKYLFANKQLDDETDLQYFEKRYYDNKIGRFTTEDPVFWEVSLTKRPSQYFIDPQQWNSYSYVRNNPVNMVDPSGELVDYSKTYVDEKTGNNYYKATNFSLADWDSHYLSDNQTSIQVSFNEIDTSSIRPDSFSAINQKIHEWIEGIYIFEGDNAANSSFTTNDPEDYTIYGDLTYKAEGSLTIDKDGKWDFKWKIKSWDDKYDFTVTLADWLDLSRFWRNVQTVGLRNIKYNNKWTPFGIQIRWEKPLSGNGQTNSNPKSNQWSKNQWWKVEKPKQNEKKK
jgi:RHS repeat-associated protein